MARSRQQRFDQQVAITRQNLSSGAAPGLESIGQDIQRFSMQQAQQAVEGFVRDQQEQALVEGQAAFVRGEQPQFREEGALVGGVRNEAFNKGLRHAYEASLANDMRETFAQIERENPDDVAAYQEELSGYRSGLLSEVDPVSLGAVTRQFDEQATLGTIRVQDSQAAKLRLESKNISENNRANSINAALSAARQGQGAQAATHLQEFTAFTDDAVDAEFIDGTQRKEDFRLAKSTVHQSDLMGQLERIALDPNQGIQAAFQALTDLGSQPQKDATQKEWDKWRADAQTELNRIASRQQAGKKAATEKIKTDLKDYIKGVASGFQFPAEETFRVQQQVIDFPELESAFNLANEVSVFSVGSADARNQILNAAQTGKTQDVERFNALVAENNIVNQGYLNDGYAFAVKQGIVEAVPINPFDPTTYETRLMQLPLIAEHSGMQPTLFTESEATSLANRLNDNGIDTGMTTAEKIQIAIGLRNAPGTWNQLDAKGAGLYAMGGAIGDRDVMQAMFDGQAALDRKNVVPLRQEEYLPVFQKQVEGIYGPNDEANVRKAALAHYAATSSHRDGTFDESEFIASIQAVTNGTGEINGFNVELPRGVPEDEFQRAINNFTPDQVARLGGVQNMTDLRAVQLIRTGRIRNADKSGEYVVLRGEEATGEGTLWSASDPNKPFIIRWEDIAATARELQEPGLPIGTQINLGGRNR